MHVTGQCPRSRALERNARDGRLPLPAFVFLLIAVLALVTDATPWSYGAGPFVAKSLGEHVGEMAPSTLTATESFLSRERPGCGAS